MEYILLIILWCVWCTVHSIMISLTITNYLKDTLRSNYRFYRVFYNLIALTTLIPLIRYNASLKGEVLFRWDGFLLIVYVLLMLIVLLLFISAAIKYDMLQLLGIRQIKSGKSHPTLSVSEDIDTSGVLGLTRHPWYLAGIIFIWIRYRDIVVSTLIVNMLLSIYIVIGTILEERKLITEYGDKYNDYKKRVSMLFPFKWIFAKLSLTNKN